MNLGLATVGVVLLIVGGFIYLMLEKVIARKAFKQGNAKLGEVEFDTFRLALWQVAFTQTFTTCGIIITVITALGLLG